MDRKVETYKNWPKLMAKNSLNNKETSMVNIEGHRYEIQSVKGRTKRGSESMRLRMCERERKRKRKRERERERGERIERSFW